MDIDTLLSELDLEEKISLIHASGSFTNGNVERLNIPSLTMSDGPHGVREDLDKNFQPLNKNDDYSVYLPTGMCLAATWNRELGYKFGEALGAEAGARGKNIILGPGINIIRTPLCGRNFEYLSEDPFLISEMVVGYIRGVQDQGVAACVKHFAANNQEYGRLWINVEMSNRALHEIYLPGFKAAVTRANALTLMGAYNQFRGSYCSQNRFLLNDILKEKWNFKGMVISDWGAVTDTKEAALSGLDLEMGTNIFQPKVQNFNEFHMADPLLNAIRKGELEENILDDKVRRILYVMNELNMFSEQKKKTCNIEYSHEVAREVAEEGIVLLKNEENILPLNKSEKLKIGIIGHNAVFKHACTGGSSMVKARYEITPLEGMQNIDESEFTLNYAQGYSIEKDILPSKKEKLLEEAIETAKKSDRVIIFGGWIHSVTETEWLEVFDAEHKDKETLTLPFFQDELITQIANVNQNIILVLFGGGAIDMQPWINKVKGLLYAWYPGMEGGNAIANIITGKTNPSGKLPVTFPVKLDDIPAHQLGEYPGNDEGTVVYKEDIFVGYRYFDTYNTRPLFCFGYGLSYSSFEYSNIELSSDVITKDTSVIVTCEVTNTGKREGAETVQLYITDVKSCEPRPAKELKGFEKVKLNSGERKKITFEILPEQLYFFSSKEDDWIYEEGEYIVHLGSSSGDIRLSKEFFLK